MAFPHYDEDEIDEVCGESFDHDLDVTYDGPDERILWCRRCGAEIWEDPEDD
jgi:hypothetical protein